MSSTPPTPLRPSSANEGWEATRAQTVLSTQIMEESEASVAEISDIGCAVDTDSRELFISCGAGEALQQQFEFHRREFITVHDLGTRSSRQLLRSIASACGKPVRKLVLRRQGFGTVLATIEHVDVSTAQGNDLRVYSTDVSDSQDATERHAVARSLMAYSQLGVMMVGNLAPAALFDALRPWHEDLLRKPWPNRELLLLPLTNTTTLVATGQELIRGTSITLRTTPVVTRPADAWNFINGTWSRMHGSNLAHATGAYAPSPPSAPRPTPGASAAPDRSPETPKAPVPRSSGTTPQRIPDTSAAFEPTASSAYTLDGPLINSAPAPAPAPAVSAPVAVPAPARPDFVATRPQAMLPMLPMPPVPDAATNSTILPDDVLDAYVEQVVQLNGVIACCVFDVGSAIAVAHSGTGVGNGLSADNLARQGRLRLRAVASSGEALGLGEQPPEIAVTLGAHHLLLRPVPHHQDMVLHVVLDRSSANLTLARLQIERLDPAMDVQ